LLLRNFQTIFAPEYHLSFPFTNRNPILDYQLTFFTNNGFTIVRTYTLIVCNFKGVRFHRIFPEYSGLPDVKAYDCPIYV